MAILEQVLNRGGRRRLKLLTWMIASGRLEVRIALREHPDCYSLFHEKIGVFTDKADNWMTFSGSPNETMSAAYRHSESFPLHRSWANEDQRAYATEERDRINAIWNEAVEGVVTWTVANSNDRMPLSQSEKVLLLIAFLGAIARLAPHYEEIAKQSEQLTKTGSVETSRRSGFPVVLDSPTSPLDEEYEIDVVDALPRLLPQIIVPVSAKSIGVWERISDKVGKAYVMELTSRTASERKVSWNGKDHVYSMRDLEVIPARTRLVSLD